MELIAAKVPLVWTAGDQPNREGLVRSDSLGIHLTTVNW